MEPPTLPNPFRFRSSAKTQSHYRACSVERPPPSAKAPKQNALHVKMTRQCSRTPPAGARKGGPVCRLARPRAVAPTPRWSSSLASSTRCFRPRALSCRSPNATGRHEASALHVSTPVEKGRAEQPESSSRRAKTQRKRVTRGMRWHLQGGTCCPKLSKPKGWKDGSAACGNCCCWVCWPAPPMAEEPE